MDRTCRVGFYGVDEVDRDDTSHSRPTGDQSARAIMIRKTAFIVCVFSTVLFVDNREALSQALTTLPPTLANHPDIQTTRFAEDLDFPTGMVAVDDSTILVAVNDGDNFFASTGRILQIQDTDGDGVADGPPVELAAGLPGGLTSLVRHGSWIFTIATRPEQQALIAFVLDESGQLTETTRISFPINSSYHLASALAVRAGAGTENPTIEVFTQFGSRENNSAGDALDFTSTSGIAGSMAAAALHRFTFEIDADGTSLQLSGHDQIASGLRNASALAFASASGDLFILENGIDGFENAIEPTSADEINIIPAGSIGGDLEDFGFPENFAEYRTGNFIGDAGKAPFIAIHPIPDFADGRESEGGSSMTWAPRLFPAPWNSGLFAGFHGQFTLAGVENEENPVLHINPDTQDYTHFISSDETGIGHINGLASTQRTLFLADMVSGGHPFIGLGQGVIYRIHSQIEDKPAEADLALELISQSPASPIQPGEILTLEFRVQNLSSVPASGISLESLIPDYFTVIDKDGCVPGENCIWNIADLGAGANTVLSVSLQLNQNISSEMAALEFMLISSLDDPVSTNNSIRFESAVRTPRPSISFSEGGTLTITWEGRARLEIARSVTGPWTDTGPTTSPAQFLLPDSQATLFIRLTW